MAKGPQVPPSWAEGSDLSAFKPILPKLAEYQDIVLKLLNRLTPTDASLVWLDLAVSLLAREVSGDVTARGVEPSVPTSSFAQFNLRLMAIRQFTRLRSVPVRATTGQTSHRVIETKYVVRCVVAYRREQTKSGPPRLTDRKVPAKAEAFRNLAAHLGLVDRKADPLDIKRRLQRAKRRVH